MKCVDSARFRTAAALLLVFVSGMTLQGCNMFSPRDAETPTQASFQYLQPTFPANVILNLQNAIGQKDVVAYKSCFTDSTRSVHNFTFYPSEDAITTYAAVLRNWNLGQEQVYFQNLVARQRQPQSYSNLALTPTDSVVSGNDSRTYNYDYVLVFEHTDATFPTTFQGSLQFTLVNDNSVWTISRWVDLKTKNDLTWSSLKGKFSN